MLWRRRDFLHHSVSLAASASIGSQFLSSLPAAAKPKDMTAGMVWLNQPPSWHRWADGLTVRSAHGTDFWREPPDDLRDNGHFYWLSVAGEFTFQSCMQGRYAGQYDHAGIMVRSDAGHWMKCGTEFYDLRPHASVVFTREFSDWSTMPEVAPNRSVWWRVLRKKEWIEAQYSRDGQSFLAVRQGYFPASDKVMVGVMCASPKGDGFEARFSDMRLDVRG